jgi:hypothetical protein
VPELTPGRRKLIEKIIEDREFPEEVISALELFLSGELELDDEQYPTLVRALLRSPDDEDATHKIGGIIFR